MLPRSQEVRESLECRRNFIKVSLYSELHEAKMKIITVITQKAVMTVELNKINYIRCLLEALTQKVFRFILDKELWALGRDEVKNTHLTLRLAKG